MKFKKDTTDWAMRSKSYNNLQWVKSSEIDLTLMRLIGDTGKKNCIDIGCGPGKLSKLLYENNNRGNYYCLDASAEMLNYVKGDVFTKIHSRIEELEGYEGHFDVAVAKMVFHHIPDIDQALEKIYGILKNSGMVLICEGHPPNRHCIDFYTEMFSYKEDRHTLTIDDIVYVLHQNKFSSICSHSLIMRNMSLLNWLHNSGVNDENKEIIYNMHKNAPEFVKQSYSVVEKDGDILMDWHFSIIIGKKTES